MSGPEWLDATALRLLVEESLAEHGGAPGLRDEGLFLSALARPENLFAYEGVVSMARLAAAYGFGVTKNHPFVDGNKRAALIAMGLFLKLNGHDLRAGQVETFEAIMKLAAGELSEAELAAWLDAHIEG